VVIPASVVRRLTSRPMEESSAVGFVDFANANLHIGHIMPSMTQEEVLFSCCPECFVGMLFTEYFEADEAMVIRNVVRFSTYEGYLYDFHWTGVTHQLVPPKQEQEQQKQAEAQAQQEPQQIQQEQQEKQQELQQPKQEEQQKQEQQKQEQQKQQNQQLGSLVHDIVVLDASMGRQSQFLERTIIRDLNKAYIGFLAAANSSARDPNSCYYISTGHWGCGAFGGDKKTQVSSTTMCCYTCWWCFFGLFYIW